MAKVKTENVHELLYECLLTLKIDVQQYLKYSNAPLNADIFCLPNKGAFQYVTYFLLSKVDQLECEKKFKFLWPPGNKKNVSEFLKLAYNWLSSLANENPEARIPKFTMSLFMTSSGDKLCSVYLALAVFILRKSLDSKKRVKYLIHPNLASETKPAALAAHSAMYENLVSQRNKLQRHEKEIHRSVSDCANDLTIRNRELKNNIKALEFSLSEANKKLCEKFDKSSVTEAKTELENNNNALLAAARALPQKMEEHYKVVFPLKNMLLTNLNCSDSAVLNGNKYPVKVAPNLTATIRNEIEKDSLFKVHKGTKLHLENLVKLFSTTLWTFDKPLKDMEAVLDIDPILRHQKNLKEELEKGLQNLNKIEDESLPSFEKIINEQQRLLSTHDAEPTPVFMEGKNYCLQQTTAELETKQFMNRSLNDSVASLLMNVSNVNWLESPESDSASSPDLRRPLNVRDAAVSRASGSAKVKAELLFRNNNAKQTEFDIIDRNCDPMILQASSKNVDSKSNRQATSDKKEEITFSHNVGKTTDISRTPQENAPTGRRSLGQLIANSKPVAVPLEDLLFGTSFNESFSPSGMSHVSLLDNQTLLDCPGFDLTSELDASNLLLELTD